MSGEEDDYGRKRDDDFNYSLTGGKAAPAQPKEPNAIERILLERGMQQREVGETAEAIVKLMGKMTTAPLAQQQDMVKTFMGQVAEQNAVAQITDLALAEVTQKGPGKTVTAPKIGQPSALTPGMKK